MIRPLIKSGCRHGLYPFVNASPDTGCQHLLSRHRIKGSEDWKDGAKSLNLVVQCFQVGFSLRRKSWGRPLPGLLRLRAEVDHGNPFEGRKRRKGEKGRRSRTAIEKAAIVSERAGPSQESNGFVRFKLD